MKSYIFLLNVFIVQVIVGADAIPDEPVTEITSVTGGPSGMNGNIQMLWGVPLERVLVFPSPKAPTTQALLPDWMREDLNTVALELYKAFQVQADSASRDKRDAESTVRDFREFQTTLWGPTGLFNSSNVLAALGYNLSETVTKAVAAVDGFQRLLGRLGTDFVTRSGFNGGTKYLYHARVWAEVLGPGDAVAPQNAATDGAYASGVVFTHVPSRTKGTPVFELIDCRGHNPPFGKDENIEAIPGMALMYPSWVNRMVPPHRCCSDEAAGGVEEEKGLLGTHRIDWVFQVGLFQFPEEVLVDFVDFERCPFQNAFREPQSQMNFELTLEELFKPVPELSDCEYMIWTGCTYCTTHPDYYAGVELMMVDNLRKMPYIDPECMYFGDGGQFTGLNASQAWLDMKTSSDIDYNRV